MQLQDRPGPGTEWCTGLPGSTDWRYNTELHLMDGVSASETKRPERCAASMALPC